MESINIYEILYLHHTSTSINIKCVKNILKHLNKKGIPSGNKLAYHWCIKYPKPKIRVIQYTYIVMNWDPDQNSVYIVDPIRQVPNGEP